MASAGAKLNSSRRPGRPRFAWQGLLIVLPVAVLAAVGLFSLREDKILAQHEATERAQAIADEIAENIWSELTSARDPSLISFKTDAAGQLISPAPFPPLPQPHPLNLA